MGQVVLCELQWYQHPRLLLCSLFLEKASHCPVCVRRRVTQKLRGSGCRKDLLQAFQSELCAEAWEEKWIARWYTCHHLVLLTIWQEVFAAPCFLDDRLRWFDPACFKGVGYLGDGVCMPVSWILETSTQHYRSTCVQCLCPLNRSLHRGLVMHWFCHVDRITCKYQCCSIYSV